MVALEALGVVHARKVRTCKCPYKKNMLELRRGKKRIGHNALVVPKPVVYHTQSMASILIIKSKTARVEELHDC
jgi:hypothetical protein